MNGQPHEKQNLAVESGLGAPHWEQNATGWLGYSEGKSWFCDGIAGCNLALSLRAPEWWMSINTWNKEKINQ